jgi:hypothetical protein
MLRSEELGEVIFKSGRISQALSRPITHVMGNGRVIQFGIQHLDRLPLLCATKLSQYYPSDFLVPLT